MPRRRYGVRPVTGDEAEREFAKAGEVFRAGVAHVPAELLLTYRDDLDDDTNEDSSLYISRRRRWRVGWAFATHALFGVTAASCFLPLLGGAPGFTTVAAALLAAGWLVLMATGMTGYRVASDARRRRTFAELISREVIRRRGGDGQAGDTVMTTLIAPSRRPTRRLAAGGGGCRSLSFVRGASEPKYGRRSFL